MTRAADRDRWLALALLLAALGLAYLFLVHPWWTAPMLDARDRIEALRERELRVRTQLQQAPEVQRRLATARRQQQAASGFLPEATAELATAGLVQRLETVVLQASPGNAACAITNRAPVNRGSQEPAYVQVAVQVRLQCGMPELASVLHALESGSPRLFIEDFNLLPIRRYVLGANRSQGSGGVDVSFDLVGYLRPTPAVPGGVAAREAQGAP